MSYHHPVLLEESVAALEVEKGGIFVDATFGGGGHTSEILRRMPSGRLIVFDQDSDVIANLPKDERLIFVNDNFRYLKNFLRFYESIPVDGILADLGVSSYQIDEPTKGFSTRWEGFLDMRMDKRKKLTAAQIINEYPELELHRIFKNYGELSQARRMVSMIDKQRKLTPIETTLQLRDAIKPLAPKGAENKFFAQVFQALRIEVNDELGALKDFLMQSIEVLRPGGRIAIISYHSLEDRLVKNFFKTGNFEGEVQQDLFGNVKSPLRPINKKPIEPSAMEIANNPRARSAKLRIAERL
ncbi:MAG TPA: 16S rRNA (cytosine(1402)-N(4))-methyltransferase RsmH [Bacteroidales bacterium]|nr:16S rRNA (cytosine(1402)-N(4))-methyltransferase RsmH [Bacteroidales bacterium]HQQ02212.1 16S rRNA (cytosine(1402)-N(4))-methyltransferase RsmH [Bacteroidales bacterium]